MTTDRLLMTVSEAAKSLGVSRSYLYGLINRGEVPCLRPGGGRVARVPRVWLDRWVEQRVREWEKARGEADGIL